MSPGVIQLRAHDGSSGEIHAFGAHVTSWHPAPGGAERLFLSAKSDLAGHAAIRGGIPVIFPQFAAEGPLPRHGFARTSQWELDASDPHAARPFATFVLRSSNETRTIWNANFAARLTVRIGGNQLRVTLSVENTGSFAFPFAAALHTYLRVHAIETTEVVGLHGARYRVSSAPKELITDTEGVIRVKGELDRVYVDAPQRVIVREPSRELIVEADGFRDLVLWNPGAKASMLNDMEPGGEHRMLCVEAAAVQQPITLESGTRWEGAQTLTAASQR